jgi:putative endonuclease
VILAGFEESSFRHQLCAARFDKLNEHSSRSLSLSKGAEKGIPMKSGYMYILECADGSYYTGSTVNLKRRIQQHQNSEGSRCTAKKWPVKLVYFEYYNSIASAFNREKQVQGWRRAKKLALIEGRLNDLPTLASTSTRTAP